MLGLVPWDQRRPLSSNGSRISTSRLAESLGLVSLWTVVQSWKLPPSCPTTLAEHSLSLEPLTILVQSAPAVPLRPDTASGLSAEDSVSGCEPHAGCALLAASLFGPDARSNPFWNKWKLLCSLFHSLNMCLLGVGLYITPVLSAGTSKWTWSLPSWSF